MTGAELVDAIFRLRGLSIFNGLAVHELKQVAEAGRRRTFAPGRTILAVGAVPDGLHVVLVGGVALSGGRAAPPVFDLPALALDRPVQTDYVAAPKEGAVLLTLERRHFHALVDAFPGVLVAALESGLDQPGAEGA